MFVGHDHYDQEIKTDNTIRDKDRQYCDQEIKTDNTMTKR
jgi:hypothetical protein